MSIDNLNNDTNQSSKDLRNFDFSGRDLSGFDFSRADLRGADLTGCRLHGTNFAEADIRGTVFSGAQFYNPDLRSDAAEAHSVELSSPESCDECIDSWLESRPGCTELDHFYLFYIMWGRPESRFMGSYGGDLGWLDDDALEMVFENLQPGEDSEFWSPEMHQFQNSIYWSRFAHNATAFLVHAMHDETTVWPDAEHLNDFPFWNQPDHVAWSPIGTFCDECKWDGKRAPAN